MDGQRYIRFPAEVAQMLDPGLFLKPIEEYEPIEMPLFRELSPAAEAEFRAYARANYVVGTPLNELHHPVCRDEQRKMNEEAGVEANGQSS